jgi:hypothetical protein
MQTNAILQAIKAPAQPALNWTSLIQAVASAIPAMVGVPVQLAGVGGASVFPG